PRVTAALHQPGGRRLAGRQPFGDELAAHRGQVLSFDPEAAVKAGPARWPPGRHPDRRGLAEVQAAGDVPAHRVRARPFAHAHAPPPAADLGEQVPHAGYLSAGGRGGFFSGLDFLDFDDPELAVRQALGDRVVDLPGALVDPLRALAHVAKAN